MWAVFRRRKINRESAAKLLRIQMWKGNPNALILASYYDLDVTR